jgi:TetR/AcrR family transcriptional regulator, transcriptional repressor for nem operon
MRYARDHKEKTRAKIVESAAAAFRREGYHATGVDKVMEEAGLTAGGFYAHFSSKDALLAGAIEHCAGKSAETFERGLEDLSDREWVAGIVEHYLAASHRGHPERGCPIPTLASEVGRAGEAPRQAFERLVGAFVGRIADHLPPADAGERAIAIAALCVGGITLARAVHDPGFSDRILAACRDFAHENLEGDAPPEARES